MWCLTRRGWNADVAIPIFLVDCAAWALPRAHIALHGVTGGGLEFGGGQFLGIFSDFHVQQQVRRHGVGLLERK